MCLKIHKARTDFEGELSGLMECRGAVLGSHVVCLPVEMFSSHIVLAWVFFSRELLPFVIFFTHDF